ncbi:MAG: discoidin domain-containing protein [Christensenellales bacterium]|jgi:hypothetical protein
MKKFISVCLVLALLFSFAPFAFAEESAAEETATLSDTAEAEVALDEVAEDEVEVAADEVVEEEEPVVYELPETAIDLLTIVAAGDTSFSGAPDVQCAWLMLSLYAHTAKAKEEYSYAEVEAMYNSVFAEGDFADVADEPSDLFSKSGEGYSFLRAEGEPATVIAVNAITSLGDGDFEVDFSAWFDVHYAFDWFRYTGTAVLTVNEDAPYGATVRSIDLVRGDITAFADASADEVLDDQYGFNYAPENAIDGQLDTCWAYTGSDKQPALTLRADAPQEVRGIVITGGYAKSESIFEKNCRIKQLRVTLSDGTVMEFVLDEVEGYEGMRVVPFEAICLTDSIEIVVTDVYPGSKYDDVCVSEILVF